MEEERRWDWCWSNNTLIALAISIIIVCFFILRMTNPSTTYGEGFERASAFTFLIVFFGVICYCCFDHFEQEKKFKAQQRIAQTRSQ